MVEFGDAGSNSADVLGDGTLVIKNVDTSASGRYSCRIITEVNLVIVVCVPVYSES